MRFDDMRFSAGVACCRFGRRLRLRAGDRCRSRAGARRRRVALDGSGGAGSAEGRLPRRASASGGARRDPRRLPRPDRRHLCRMGRPGSHRVIAPWTLIDGRQSAAAFADAIARGRSPTCTARRYRARSSSRRDCSRRTVSAARARSSTSPATGRTTWASRCCKCARSVLERGITINGLPIMLHADYLGGYSIPNLDVYYEDCVIGGPGAFLVTVEIDRPHRRGDPAQAGAGDRRSAAEDHAGADSSRSASRASIA